MNLAPYIEFLLKLRANSLVLQVNKIPRLQLKDKEKIIGKKTITIEDINTLINNFLDNSQKKELLRKKKICSTYTTSKGSFTVQIEKNVNHYILKISPENKPTIKSKEDISQQLGMGLALLRISLGIIILVTWYQNIATGFYTSDGIIEYIKWLFDSTNGNGSSLTFYKEILDKAISPIAEVFAIFMLVLEFAVGLGLLLGVFTRFFSLLSMLLFFNYFLAYFGGFQWIWSYVLLIMSSLVVFTGHAGRKWGIDSYLQKWHGDPRYPILW
ncbi:MAG: DoxX family protein [Methylococcaceae bacterium]|nr:DoxX family protein [Methylococcaceae bacterium]